MQKTSVEHPAAESEESLTLLSKKKPIYPFSRKSISINAPDEYYPETLL